MKKINYNIVTTSVAAGSNSLTSFLFISLALANEKVLRLQKSKKP